MPYRKMNPDAPCQGCKDRTIEPVRCHTNCQKYHEWLEMCHRNKQAEKASKPVFTGRWDNSKLNT